jgi:nucleotidyltransferase AbiEii toxin of type IV toxin-antitoxin system
VSGRTPQQAYLDLQKLARSQGRNTQQLFELYVHERFLARLAASPYAERFVLKGGMLLAVLDVRRATRDADMLARGLASDEDSLRTVVKEILAISMEDGVSFDPAGIAIASIREDADYEGLRLTLPVDLAGAVLKLRLDLSFGDPVKPHRVDYPTLLGGQTFQLLGYPLENVIAEKADTMMFLGDANTRDRDYGDVYLLSEIHAIDAELLRRALNEVAEHRRHELRPLGPQLETLRQARLQPWAAFRARVGLASLPERFSEVVDRVVEIVDGVHEESVSRWQPAERRWM